MTQQPKPQPKPQPKSRGRRVPEVPPVQKREVMVYLTPEEVRRLKYQAVDEDRTMSAIMADALRVYLTAHPLRGPR